MFCLSIYLTDHNASNTNHDNSNINHDTNYIYLSIHLSMFCLSIYLTDHDASNTNHDTDLIIIKTSRMLITDAIRTDHDSNYTDSVVTT